MQQPPTTDPGVIFFLFVVGCMLLAGIARIVLGVARWNSNRIRYVTPTVRGRPLQNQGVRRISAGFDPENEPENPPNLAPERRTDDRTGAFALNPDECAAVARMIEHKMTAEKPTKASTIWAGFGVKKGASAKYQRASEIFDTLFILPEPDSYPLMTAEQRQEREKLGLLVR